VPKYIYDFYVERELQGEDVEIQLQVELDVEPFVRGKYSGPPEGCFPDEGGMAQIDGPIMVRNTDGKFEPWDESLTESEISKVEEEGYAAWVDAEAEFDDDFNDPEFDEFRDDRAIALAGGGKVFY
jgi:hypothetical protein